VVAEWPSASDTSGEPTLYTDDLTDVHFTENGMAFTIAFVPEGETPPPPPTSQDLAELGALDGGDPTGEVTVPGDSSASTTAPAAADPNATTTTAPAGETTTTTAAAGG